VEVARRTKSQARPPHVVFEALTQPHRPQGREWLLRTADEIEPQVLDSTAPNRVVWSTLWSDHPSARIEFTLSGDSNGTDLTWVLMVADDAVPDDAEVRALRHRLNELINGNMRNILFDF
jgi:hypothetical protein